MCTELKTSLIALFPPQIPHELTRNPTRTVALRSRRLTDRGVTLCFSCCYRLLRSCLEGSWCSASRISKTFCPVAKPYASNRVAPSLMESLYGGCCYLVATYRQGTLFYLERKNKPWTCYEYVYEIVTYTYIIHLCALPV